MGTCKYCGKSAGLFSSKHKECDDLHNQGLADAESIVSRYFAGTTDINNVRSSFMNARRTAFFCKEDAIAISCAKIQEYTDSLPVPAKESHLTRLNDYMVGIKLTHADLDKTGVLTSFAKKICYGYAHTFFCNGASSQLSLQQQIAKVNSMFPISSADINDVYLQVLNDMMQSSSQTTLLSPNQMHNITSYVNALGLSLTNIPPHFKGSALERVGQMTVLHGLQNGTTPHNNMACPILLAKGESLLWTFNNVTMYQEKVEKEYQGRRGGWSFRVIKGVTYHTGNGRMKPVENRYMNNEGIGELYVTNRNLIFQSSTSAQKVSYSKIIGITPYSDGIEVHRDGANVKRLTFQGFDSWFVMNVLQILNS